MKIDFDKNNGLVPAVIQDAETKNVLMQGYMNEEAYMQTIKTKRVTFFSRSKNRLWTKGETSNNYLNFVKAEIDCDNDSLLVFVKPDGPTCHKGTDTCWGSDNNEEYGFLSTLENVISGRKMNLMENSYTASLFKKGINKIAQKVGEEAIELVIESKDNNDDLFINESADLLFHYLILLQAKGYKLNDVVKQLKKRQK